MIRLAAALAVLLLAAIPAAAQTPYRPLSAPAPGAGVCPGGLCQPEALDSLFFALSETEAGRRREPVRILQIGDSHTAGGRITGALRGRLQARFGRAGRGVLAPMADATGLLVMVESTGWIVDTAPLQPPNGAPSPVVGLSGRRATGLAEAGATLTLSAEPGAEIGVIGVCARPLSGAAELRVEAGALPRSLVFAADGPACRVLTLDHGAGVVRLSPLGAGLILDSLWVEQTGAGVVVSGLGVSGATLRDLARRDEAVVAAELAAMQPELIILAFGTNEGFDDALDARAYEALLRGQIARLRRLAPSAALLIVGAPDALRRGVSPACPGAPERGPPPSLVVVRDVQRRVAADLGVAFWDWHGRMGGDCSADGLAKADPPLMRGDRVHFTGEGADWIGAVLADDLMRAHDAWRGVR